MTSKVTATGGEHLHFDSREVKGEILRESEKSLKLVKHDYTRVSMTNASISTGPSKEA